MRSSQIIDSIFSEALGQLKRGWQGEPSGQAPDGGARLQPPGMPDRPERPGIPEPEELAGRLEAADISDGDDDDEAGRQERAQTKEPPDADGGALNTLDDFAAAQWRLADGELPLLADRADNAQTGGAAEYGQTIKENTVAAKKAKVPEDDRQADFPPELENSAEQEEDLDALLEDLANSTLPQEDGGTHDFINTDGFDPAGDESAEEADELYTFGEAAGGTMSAQSTPDTSGHSLDDLLEHALGLNDVPEEGGDLLPADEAADEAETNSALDELIGGLSANGADDRDLFGENADAGTPAGGDEDDLFGENTDGLSQDDDDSAFFQNEAQDAAEDEGEINAALAGLVGQIGACDECDDQPPTEEPFADDDDGLAEDGSGLGGLAGMEGLDEIGQDGGGSSFVHSGGSVEPALSDDLFGEGADDAQDEDTDVVRTIPVPEPSIPLTEDVDAELEKKLAEMGLGGDNLLHNRFSAEKEKLLRHLMDRFEALARRKLEPLSCEQVPLIRSVNLRVEIDLKFGEFVASGADDSLFSLDLGNGLSKG